MAEEDVSRTPTLAQSARPLACIISRHASTMDVASTPNRSQRLFIAVLKPVKSGE